MTFPLYCVFVNFSANRYEHPPFLLLLQQWQEDAFSCRFCCQDRLKVDGHTMTYLRARQLTGAHFMDQMIVRENTDTSQTQAMVPIYVFHTLEAPFCPLPGCECHTN